jgi:hypothetical protein
MTAGKLASAKPGATTNTFLYRAPITSAASATLNVVNQSGSSATYRAALRDYDQTLTLDSSSYKFRKGNVVSTYLISLIPGIQKNSLTAGSIVATESTNGNFRFLDVFIDSSIKEIPTKVAAIGTISLATSPTGGTLAPGNILTGAKGLTATVYTYNTLNNNVTASIPDVTSASTSLYFSDVTSILNNDLIAIPDKANTNPTYELVLATNVNTSTNIVTSTRAQLGSTAAIHASGASCVILRPTATTTTLTAAIADGTATTISVTSATSLTVGDYVRIGNELLLIMAINGNDVDVDRGEFSTTAAAAASGATVTLVTNEGNTNLNYFSSGEALTSGSISTTLSSYIATGNPFSPSLRFVFDINEDGAYEAPIALSLDLGRTYRFIQSDSSNTNHSLRFFVTGVAGEYTTGITVNGTAGSSGSYTEIVVSSLTSTSLNVYDTDESGYDLPANINTNPTYTLAYIYDLDGTITVGDSFGTLTGTNDISAIYPGPYGYVHDYTSTSLKVSLGLNSTAFAEYTTTITGTSGTKTITVGSATNLIIGMSVSGTGIATGARIIAISGTTVTLDLANTGAVSGTGTFEHMFYDSPREAGSTRGSAKVSTYTASTDINDGDYLFYGKSISANSTDKNTGIVIGPGQSVVVYSSAADLNYVLNGFEDSTSDFTINVYNRV